MFFCIIAGGVASGSDKSPPLTAYTIPAANARDAKIPDYQKEVDICDEGLKIFPGNPDLRELRAEGLGGLGKFEEAEKIFQELIHSEKPDDRAILIWTLAGYQRMLTQQNRTAEADAVGQQIVELEKQSPKLLAQEK